jgi:hypothetical protein
VHPLTYVDSNHLWSSTASCFTMSLLQDAHKTLFCWCLCLLHRSCLPWLSHRKVGVQRAVGTMDATPPVHGHAHHPRCGDRIAGPNLAPCFWVGVENQWRRSQAVALVERPWPFLLGIVSSCRRFQRIFTSLHYLPGIVWVCYEFSKVTNAFWFVLMSTHWAQ